MSISLTLYETNCKRRGGASGPRADRKQHRQHNALAKKKQPLSETIASRDKFRAAKWVFLQRASLHGSGSTCAEEPGLTHKPVKHGENAYGTPDPSPPASAALQKKLYLWATWSSVSAAAAAAAVRDTLIVDYAQSLASLAIR